MKNAELLQYHLGNTKVYFQRFFFLRGLICVSPARIQTMASVNLCWYTGKTEGPSVRILCRESAPLRDPLFCFTKATCVCDEGYDSPMCAQWTGSWSQWSPWGRCSPSCGPERWAIRHRHCLSLDTTDDDDEGGNEQESRECIGSAVDFSPCEQHACARTFNPW